MPFVYAASVVAVAMPSFNIYAANIDAVPPLRGAMPAPAAMKKMLVALFVRYAVAAFVPRYRRRLQTRENPFTPPLFAACHDFAMSLRSSTRAPVVVLRNTRK